MKSTITISIGEDAFARASEQYSWDKKNDVQNTVIGTSDALHSSLAIWLCKVFQNHVNTPKSEK